MILQAEGDASPLTTDGEPVEKGAEADSSLASGSGQSPCHPSAQGKFLN